MKTKNSEPRRNPDGSIRDWEELQTEQERQQWFQDKTIPEPNTGCWIWAQQWGADGYGKAWFGPYRNGGGYAHRISYTLFTGPIPQGMHVLHKCDTPCCCNPRHLYVGTHQRNMLDVWERDRRKRKRRLITVNGETRPIAEWAEKNGISKNLINRRLKHGWSEVEAVTATPSHDSWRRGRRNRTAA